MNAQPWHFVIIESEERKRQVGGLCEKGEKLDKKRIYMGETLSK